MALSNGGDKYVIVAIVVIIANRYAHAIEVDSQSGTGGHISECAVAIVVKELNRAAAGIGVSRPILTVDEENVWEAVVIVVNECAAGSQSFRQVFLAECAIVMNKANARGLRDIGKVNSRVEASRSGWWWILSLARSPWRARHQQQQSRQQTNRSKPLGEKGLSRHGVMYDKKHFKNCARDILPQKICETMSHLKLATRSVGATR